MAGGAEDGRALDDSYVAVSGAEEPVNQCGPGDGGAAYEDAEGARGGRGRGHDDEWVIVIEGWWGFRVGASNEDERDREEKEMLFRILFHDVRCQ